MHLKPLIPTWLDESNLGPFEFRLYCHLICKRTCYESAKSLASVVGIERRRLVYALQTLVRRGFVHRLPRPDRTSILIARVEPQLILPLENPSDLGSPGNGIP